MADQSSGAKRGRKTGAGNAFLTADSDAVHREPDCATTSNRRGRGRGEREEIRMHTAAREGERSNVGEGEEGGVEIVGIG